MIMSNLLSYLNTLDKDAVARDAHNADPQAAMANFGLLDHEQQAVLSGDHAALANAAGIDAAEMPFAQIANGQFNKRD